MAYGTVSFKEVKLPETDEQSGGVTLVIFFVLRLNTLTPLGDSPELLVIYKLFPSIATGL